MILVAGATGMVGSEVCRLLREQNRSVRALVRSTSDEEVVNRLKALGTEISVGDVLDRSSVERACENAESVICTVSACPTRYDAGRNTIANVDRDGLLNLVEAAEDAGVRYFGFVSLTMEDSFPLSDAKRAVERRLKAGKMSYTILKPSYFMETWLSAVVGFDFENARAKVYGNGNEPVGYISYEDAAKFTAKAIDTPAARNATIPLGGPESISQNKAIEIFEAVSGRKFERESVSQSTLEKQLAAASDQLEVSFAGLMLTLAKGDPVEMAGAINTFGVQPMSVADYAKAVVNSGGNHGR